MRTARLATVPVILNDSASGEKGDSPRKSWNFPLLIHHSSEGCTSKWPWETQMPQKCSLLILIIPYSSILNGCNREPYLFDEDEAIKERYEKGPPGRRAFIVRILCGVTYATFTSIAFGFAFSDFGRWRLSTPSLNSAFTLSSSITSGKEKVLTKLP